MLIKLGFWRVVIIVKIEKERWWGAPASRLTIINKTLSMNIVLCCLCCVFGICHYLLPQSLSLSLSLSLCPNCNDWWEGLGNRRRGHRKGRNWVSEMLLIQCCVAYPRLASSHYVRITILEIIWPHSDLSYVFMN